MSEDAAVQGAQDQTPVNPAINYAALTDIKSMQDLATRHPEVLRAVKTGDVVSGNILSVGKNEVYITIPGLGLGIVRGREIYDDKIYLANLKYGDEVVASVVDADNEQGYVEMSFRQAGHERVWSALREKLEGKTAVETKILDANKGGLIVEINGVTGFLPVSQLTTQHYPRVEDGDKSKILEALKQYIGQTFQVMVITADPKEEKLIVSEKAVIEPKLEQKLDKLEVGKIIEGTVTGVVDFGAFVKFNSDEDLEGLVHISELAWQRIEDPKDIVKVGDQVKAQVISIDDGRISLSLKRLAEDPWQEAIKKYSVGQIVTGTVTKILAFGAFVELDRDIQGLVHIGELADPTPKDASEVIKVGEKREFKIINIEPADHRLGLSLKALNEKPAEKKTKEKGGAKAEEAASEKKEDKE